MHECIRHSYEELRLKRFTPTPTSTPSLHTTILCRPDDDSVYASTHWFVILSTKTPANMHSFSHHPSSLALLVFFVTFDWRDANIFEMDGWRKGKHRTVAFVSLHVLISFVHPFYIFDYEIWENIFGKKSVT